MQSIFKRCEKKYLVATRQRVALADIIARHMPPDSYGEYLVQNVYYDTDAWDVIRASIEKPIYKEKLRLRCYGVPNDGDRLFLELKKKYKGVVYKRRVDFPAAEVRNASVREIIAKRMDSQIARELGFYLKRNPVSEKVWLAYRRSAFAGIGDEAGLRITFDTDIRFRTDKWGFLGPDGGTFILPQETTLMEIKALDGMPLWMARALSDYGVFPTSFSKYGTCYTEHIMSGGMWQSQRIANSEQRVGRVVGASA
ncbi:MAG: polyphosphate polymerase domain-containing protein [Coriobacteriales bacterium]|jgi:hypothetical protein|nr:polyphosphate polymerase domain-containing protein [Coriobacteriales bacterium]